MTPHRWFLAASFGLTVLGSSLVMIPSTAYAQSEETPAPEVENSRYQFQGMINSNSVYVRSGPSENNYPTMKLDKGAMVTVVGISYDWLKVLPPEGSFCYVSKAFVQKRGDGSVGRVMKANLSVRAGSAMSSLKTMVQTNLNIGEDVEIVRDDGEYFIIKPPAGAYVYINKKDVDPVRPLNADTAHPASDTGSADGSAVAAPSGDQPSIEPGTGTVAGGSDNTTGPAVSPVASEASTKAQVQFDKLDADLRAASAKPLAQQPLADLKKQYEQLIAGNQLPGSLQQLAQQRLALIDQQIKALADLDKIRSEHEAMNQKQKALQAEQNELQERLASHDVQVYAAVGTLWPSSLQVGTGGTLYRLTDPANGRTLVYVRSDDPTIANMAGQFIGVQGKVLTDAQLGLQVISAAGFHAVDVSKVNNGIMAQIVPPSLNNKTPTASADEPH